MQLLISLVIIYHHSMQFRYLHTSISTSKTSYCYDNKSDSSELTLVCIPKVRKNRIRCVMNRRRCPGSTLLSLESHLLNSSIKPIASREMWVLAIPRERKHLRNITKSCIYSFKKCDLASKAQQTEQQQFWEDLSVWLKYVLYIFCISWEKLYVGLLLPSDTFTGFHDFFENYLVCQTAVPD